MTKAIWKDIIASLPKGLTIAQAAKLLRYSETLVRRRMEDVGYKWAVVEKSRVPPWAKDLNWKLANSELARNLCCSRERIRQIRDLLGKPKVENRGRTRKISTAEAPPAK
jgi:hypothetical protein